MMNMPKEVREEVLLTFPEILRISGKVSILVASSNENAKDKFNR